MNKTKKWLGALALIIMCAFTFSACGGDDDDNNGGSSNTTSLVGTWRMDFGTNSYVLLTLNQDGTGRYREYDHDYWQHDDSFTYTYSNGVVLVTTNGNTKKIEVLSISQTTLVLKDFPDKGTNTFIKQ